MVKGEVFVHQQRELQFLLFNEALVGLGGVLRNTEDHVVLAVQAPHVVSKITGLRRASRGGVLGVEVEDHRLSVIEVGLKGVFFSVFVHGGKAGGDVASAEFNRFGHGVPLRGRPL